MSALSADSLQTGAVITFRGDQMVASGAGIVEAAESRLIGTAPERRDQWLIPEVPVLSRGDAWIIPLFWMPESRPLDQAESPTLDARSKELGQSIMSACRYAHGEPLSIDFDGRDALRVYAAELTRTGAATGAWWAIGDWAIVLVYYRADDGEPTQRMALHVVPVGWVSARRPAKAKKIPSLDLAWSGADIVAFAAADSDRHSPGPT